MLFPYIYVNHEIEKMQEYIDFIFYEVWCNAPKNDYSIDLFSSNKELQDILLFFWNQDLAGKPVKKSATFFLQGINSIFNAFKNLDNDDINQLKSWYVANNDIKKCTANDSSNIPIRYSEMTGKFNTLANFLKDFFTNLYNHEFLKLKIIKDSIGTISDHYIKFVQQNNEGICPFCGIMPLDDQWDPTRDAYDHFLPKSKYPFNTINFRNLIPACNACNSKNKRDKDPLFSDDTIRKTFYIFNDNKHKLEIDIKINSYAWTINYTPQEIILSIGPDQYRSEINTWLDLYNIDSRYKSFMCKKNFGKAWISEVVNWLDRGRDLDSYFNELIDNENTSPYSGYNFLKKPFLEACKQANLFNPMADI